MKSSTRHILFAFTYDAISLWQKKKTASIFLNFTPEWLYIFRGDVKITDPGLATQITGADIPKAILTEGTRPNYSGYFQANYRPN